MHKKILILSVVYFNTDIIKKHIDFLTTVTDIADIIILENPSESTSEIKQYCLDLVNKQKIKQYCLFNDNICGGVFKEIYKDIDLTNYEYIMMTDGDLTVDNITNWLDEQIEILINHPDTFTCAVDLSLENLPVHIYPKAENWHPKPISISSDSIDGQTGIHLLLFKKNILNTFMNQLYDSDLVFVDNTMHNYCVKNQLRWKRTKFSKAYHHTWDLYTSVEHSYTIMKNSISHEKIWYHNKKSNYQSYDLDSLKLKNDISKKDVTVVILTYNHKNYIEEAVNSVLMQKTDYNIDILIGDDCSTDNTYDIVKDISTNNNQIRYYKNSTNLGVTKNLQKAFSLCSGEYIAFCEGDDYWIDKNKINYQLNFLKNNPTCSGCFHHFIIHDEILNKETTLEIPKHDVYKYDTKMIIENTIASNFTTTVYRKKFLDKIDVKIFDIFSVDWVFNIAISEFGYLACIDKYMSVYRVHNNGLWSAEKDKKNALQKSVIEYDKFFNMKYAESFNKLKINTVLEKRHSIIKKRPRRLLTNRRKQVVKERLLCENTKALKRKRIVTSQRIKKRLIVKPKIRDINMVHDKLHIGCGENYLKNNWLNVDLNPTPSKEILNGAQYKSLNLITRFSFVNIKYIYSEHFIEHLDNNQGIQLIKNCFNSLIDGGVCRVATFDLDILVDTCRSDNKDWAIDYCVDDLKLLGHVKTRGQLLNDTFYNWEHKYVYNKEDLSNVFEMSGFKNIKYCQINESDHPDLKNLETRINSTLIIEGTK